MNHLSFYPKGHMMEQLLDGVEVEWKALGDVATLRRGRVMSKGYLVENAGDFPVYSSQTARNGMIGKIDTFDFNGEFISWTTDGANAGTVFYRTGKFSITNVCGLIKINDESILSYKYLFYWLTIEAQKHVYSGMGNPKLMSHQVEKIPTPIPCPDNPEKSLEIQAEIVRILDAFTAMTAELTAELNLRQQQYNHYRDQLLSFDDPVIPRAVAESTGPCDFAQGDTTRAVEWKTLGEVGQVRMCKRILKAQTSPEGEVPFYKIGTFGKEPDAYIPRKLFEEYKEKYNYPKKGEVLISASGTIGRTVIFNGEDAYFQDSNIVWIENDESIVLNKFLFYFYQIANWGVAEGGTIKRLYSDNLRKLLVPVPYPNDAERSLSEQARIVAILDKFDMLTTSLTEGLPREIELRQQQYEYYRDLLLSFPKQHRHPARSRRIH